MSGTIIRFLRYCILTTPLIAVAMDPVLEWNALTREAIRIDNTSGPRSSRNLAMVHAAIFDTVNSITGERQPVHIRKFVTGNVSKDAAVAAAAHQILAHLYPKQAESFDRALVSCYDDLEDEEAKQAGVTLGREVANEIIAWRANDFSSSKIAYDRTPGPGVWQPAKPNDAIEVQWPRVTCFCIGNSKQFMPQPPPKLNSEEYTQVYYDVKRLGQKATRTRTSDQTASALFWNAGKSTAAYWNAVAAQFASQEQLSVDQNAHLFALLNLAIADAAIATWDCKYKYCFWRPVEAIHFADTDGNFTTQPDPDWEPLLATPAHPEYVSAHSALSGAAAKILTAYFGEDLPFSSDVEGDPGDVRAFTSFSQAADDAGRSRIYGGIHFQSGNESGLKLGRQVGSFVISNALRRHDTN